MFNCIQQFHVVPQSARLDVGRVVYGDESSVLLQGNDSVTVLLVLLFSKDFSLSDLLGYFILGEAE